MPATPELPDPFAPPETRPDRRVRTVARYAALQKAHWITFGLIWLIFAVIDTMAIRGGLDSIPEKSLRVLFAPIAALSGPFVGSYSRGFGQGCCTDIGLWLLPYVGGAATFGTILQWLWRPQALAARIARMTLWSSGWFLWFSSALPALAHALS